MKERLRQTVKRERNSLNQEEWEKKSLLIQDKLVHESYFAGSRCLLCYAHMDREVRTDLILDTALKSGKIVCLPYVQWQEKILLPSRIFSAEEIVSCGLVPGPAQLRFISPEKLDLVVVPGVVFDIYGNRIGQGGGFYDRFFRQRRKEILKVALAFSFQVQKFPLPVDGDDVPVDVIITEENIYQPAQKL